MKVASVGTLLFLVCVGARSHHHGMSMMNVDLVVEREEKPLGVCPGRLHKVCDASVKRLCHDVSADYHENVMEIYACMGRQDKNDIDSECVQLVESNPITNARVVCAPEVFEACPHAGYFSRAGHHIAKRCVHDVFTKGLGKNCKAAFDVAFSQYKEIELIDSNETSPMDSDVMRILVQKPEPPMDSTGSEDLQLIVMVFGGTVGMFLFIGLFCCCKNRRKARAPRSAARPVIASQSQNDYLVPVSEDTGYHPLVDNTPSAPPVAQPYKPQNVVIVATPYSPPASYPGIIN